MPLDNSRGPQGSRGTLRLPMTRKETHSRTATYFFPAWRQKATKETAANRRGLGLWAAARCVDGLSALTCQRGADRSAKGERKRKVFYARTAVRSVSDVHFID